jgi:hypothetical protein
VLAPDGRHERLGSTIYTLDA